MTDSFHPVAPDDDPSRMLGGRDLQLDAAVDVLMDATERVAK